MSKQRSFVCVIFTTLTLMNHNLSGIQLLKLIIAETSVTDTFFTRHAGILFLVSCCCHKRNYSSQRFSTKLLLPLFYFRSRIHRVSRNLGTVKNFYLTLGNCNFSVIQLSVIPPIRQTLKVGCNAS